MGRTPTAEEDAQLRIKALDRLVKAIAFVRVTKLLLGRHRSLHVPMEPDMKPRSKPEGAQGDDEALERLGRVVVIIGAAGVVLNEGFDAAMTLPAGWLRVVYTLVVLAAAVFLWVWTVPSIVSAVGALPPANSLAPSSKRSRAFGWFFAFMVPVLFAGLFWGEVQAIFERHALTDAQPR